MHMDPEDAFQTGPRMLLPMQLLSLALLLGIGLATLLLSKLVESWVPAVRLWLRRGSASRLPPGTMGWPLLGETLHFFSQEPGFFFQGKQKRYVQVHKLKGLPLLSTSLQSSAVLQVHLPTVCPWMALAKASGS